MQRVIQAERLKHIKKKKLEKVQGVGKDLSDEESEGRLTDEQSDDERQMYARGVNHQYQP